MDMRDVVKRPIVTEKSTGLMQGENKYTFEVALAANKTEIKHAVEQLFKVHVTEVRTMRVRGKVKKLGRFEGRRPDWKKAIVTLRQGDSIQVFEGV